MWSRCTACAPTAAAKTWPASSTAARSARDWSRPGPKRNREARYKPSNRGLYRPSPGTAPGFCPCAAFRVRLGFWFTGHCGMAPVPACTRRPACLKEVPITVPAVESMIVRAGAVGSSPRRGTSEPGIACFILADAGSPAPVVNDHCANGGQGGTGHPVVVAAQQESSRVRASIAGRDADLHHRSGGAAAGTNTQSGGPGPVSPVVGRRFGNPVVGDPPGVLGPLARKPHPHLASVRQPRTVQ